MNKDAGLWPQVDAECCLAFQLLLQQGSQLARKPRTAERLRPAYLIILLALGRPLVYLTHPILPCPSWLRADRRLGSS